MVRGEELRLAGLLVWAVGARLDEVEKQDLSGGRSGKAKGVFAGHGGAVARGEREVVQGYGTFGHMNPRMPVGRQSVKGRIALLKATDPELSILVDGDGTLPPGGRGHPLEASWAGVGERLLLVARRQPAAIGSNPDLEKVNGFGRGRVELAVLHARSRRHVLNISRAYDAAIPHGVPVLKGATQDVRDDFHVAMRVGGETAAAGDDVVVDHPEGTESHVVRGVVVSEGKGVGSLEPAMIGLAAVRGASESDSGVGWGDLSRCHGTT